MTDSIKRYIRHCDLCAARKQTRPAKAPLGQAPAGEPMEKVSIDILGPLPLTDNGNRYVLVINDCFTKYVEAVALPNAEAKTIATAFVNEFICKFGTPLSVQTDSGTNFDSVLFREVCDFLQIHKVKTSIARPEANGVTERFNRTLADMLSMYCKQNQRQWDRYIPQVLMAYRSSTHSSTNKTPNMMIFGREITLPMAAVIGIPRGETQQTPDDYVEELQQNMKMAHDVARKNLEKETRFIESDTMIVQQNHGN